MSGRVYERYPRAWPGRSSALRTARGGAILEELRARSVVTEGECWIWTGAKQSAGYGIVRYRGKVVTTHKLALTAKLQLQGKRLGDRYSCHVCPTATDKLCCNPEHLEPGSQSKNMKQWWASRPPAELTL